MSEPNVAAPGPVLLELDPGRYFWCRCGLSKKQPLCDGSHKNGTDLVPLKFEIGIKEKRYYCQCKHTGRAPFCDGTHKTLPETKK
jgi:CDGSH-type Zn-finger protein